MPKVFDNPEIPERRMDEDIWFQINQPILLWIANTKQGRDTLCIDQGFPRICAIAKNYIKAKNKDGSIVAEFRIGSKWGNIIRYRWKEFLKLEQAYWKYNDIYNTLKFPQNFGLLAATTLTAYPNPDIETVSVDGLTRENQTNVTWATLRGGAGNQAADNQASNTCGAIDSGTTTDRWDFMDRGFFLFDTSAIGASNIILSADFSLWVESKADNFSQSLSVVSSNPASNTALVSADHTTLGTTRFATDKTIASLTAAAYNTYTLNASGLNAITRDGITKFGTRLSGDLDNVEPTWASNFQGSATISYADTAGTGQDPKLVVIWVMPFSHQIKRASRL